jgi:hypothetical protein
VRIVLQEVVEEALFFFHLGSRPPQLLDLPLEGVRATSLLGDAGLQAQERWQQEPRGDDQPENEGDTRARHLKPPNRIER